MKVVVGTIVAVKQDDRLLLLKRAMDDTEPGLWEFPKGTYENFDLTIHDTAKRELEEETGLKAADVRYLGDISRKEDDALYTGYAYLASKFHGEIRLSAEHEKYQWVKKPQLAEYKLSENTLAFLRLYGDCI